MKALGKALIALSPALLLGQCTVEFFAVDRCLDAGNVYDYAQGLCRADVLTLPYVPYLERSWAWFATALAGFGIGIMLLFSARHRAS